MYINLNNPLINIQNINLDLDSLYLRKINNPDSIHGIY